MTGDGVEIQLGRNEALYRSVNDRIEELNRGFEDGLDLTGEWLCECADPGCTSRVTATTSEYQSIRADPRTFMVYPGHVAPEVERVARRNERFTVVEKLGDRAVIAEATDPRAPVGT